MKQIPEPAGQLTGTDEGTAAGRVHALAELQLSGR